MQFYKINNMKRRRFISSMAIIIPATVISTEFIFSSCNDNVVKEEHFNEENIKLLDEIGETIIPTSSTSPGAKAARVGEFMKVYVTDCFNATDQEIFMKGISSFKKLSKKKYGSDFLQLRVSQKLELLNEFEKKAQEHTTAKHKEKSARNDADAVQSGKEASNDKIVEDSDHYFTMIKNLTLLGYFTSEPGATKALRYIQTPGYFAGEVPYKRGDKSWAT